MTQNKYSVNVESEHLIRPMCFGLVTQNALKAMDKHDRQEMGNLKWKVVHIFLPVQASFFTFCNTWVVIYV